MVFNKPDLEYLREFVREVVTICNNDDVGITYGIRDLALNAGRILGLSKVDMENLE